MEELKYEWRQYDSDSIPDVYAGPPTEERREAWRLTHERKFHLAIMDSCKSISDEVRGLDCISRYAASGPQQVQRRTQVVALATTETGSISRSSGRYFGVAVYIASKC